MTGREINHILCAVRGAPKSRDTVSRAIDLALEHEAKLTFIHTLDAEFLNHSMTATDACPIDHESFLTAHLSAQ